MEGGESGDLYVKVVVGKDAHFAREGATDIVTKVGVPLSQAVLGTEIDVRTLSGTERVSIRSGTNSGDRIVLKGRGIKMEEDHADAGDHIVELKVLIPRQVNENVRRIFQEFAKEESSYNEFDQFAEEIVASNRSGGNSFSQNEASASGGQGIFNRFRRGFRQ